MTRKPGRPAEPIEHGTVKGYKQERYRGMPTCQACRDAWAQYHRERRVLRNR